jgi:hypothetical protein
VSSCPHLAPFCRRCSLPCCRRPLLLPLSPPSSSTTATPSAGLPLPLQQPLPLEPSPAAATARAFPFPCSSRRRRLDSAVGAFPFSYSRRRRLHSITLLHFPRRWDASTSSCALLPKRRLTDALKTMEQTFFKSLRRTRSLENRYIDLGD